MSSSIDLAGLLASRICHDLVSPVGAVVNGTDLLRELAGEDTSAEMDLIAESADRASALLQFYRIAFGAGEDAGATLSRPILQSQADRFLVSENVYLSWHGVEGPPLRRGEARLFYQLLMCARHLLGRRGRLEVTFPGADGTPLTIAALPMSPVTGQAPVIDPDLLAMLAHEPAPEDVSARRIEFALVHQSARGIGQEITVGEATGHVVLSACEAQPVAISLSAVR